MANKPFLSGEPVVPQDHAQVIESALNRIAEYNRGLEAARSECHPTGHTLFHYTTADGLEGIIRKSELWATSAYHLDDSTEITYGYGVLNEVLKEWISGSNLPEESLALGMATQLKDGFGNHLLNRALISPIFLACFCEDGNLLSQWRAYGQSGYCLGFKAFAEGPVQAMRPEPDYYTARWAKVEYDRTIQIERCRRILDDLLPILDDPDTKLAVQSTRHPLLHGYQELLTAISEILMEEIVAFKRQAFHVEREWRIVVRSRDSLDRLLGGKGYQTPPIHFRTSRALLTPYVSLIPMRNDPILSIKYEGVLPIESVRSGPNRDQTTDWMAVQMLLDQHGYRGGITRAERNDSG